MKGYIGTLSTVARETPKKGYVPLSHAICYIINTFCKVRGEKVIKGFFNNEPRYLLPILNELETSRNFKTGDSIEPFNAVVPWVERYVLLSWLSHSMLAPFPLESMSALQPSEEFSALLDIELPPNLPGVTLRVLTVCTERLKSASKERGAAANLLVRLCVRPDMQEIGLLDILVRWSLSFFNKAQEGQADIHLSLGVLSFLSGLVASATTEELGSSLSTIYDACRSILDHESLIFVKSSAVARKLIVKILRTIVVHCQQPASVVVGLDATTILEEVIEFLLEAVADGDTPVRYGASKALSVITLKLDSEMAAEVVEAILGSLNESVYWQGTKRNLSGVNPLRWHGLTLTLAQLLYRKAISTSSLPDVLNALLLSLSFEQRSPTGGSSGTNVRDSACFGIWALTRRYATSDLLKIDTASIRACEHDKSLSVPQALAIELVTAACLDPAGNIRRGSSAALQELIGRHPNTIEQGIPLVQIVDFHAVGLRQRAMCDVAIKTAEMHSFYWEALFEHLLGWRGTGSLDSDSRLFAAKAVGFLSNVGLGDMAQRMSEQVCDQLTDLRPREVEERQGLVSTLAALVSTTITAGGESGAEASVSLLHLWRLFDKELMLEDKAFMSPALRPEMTASSILHFITAMASLTNLLPKQHRPVKLPTAEVVRVINLCLGRYEDTVLEAITTTVPTVTTLLSSDAQPLRDAMLDVWLSKLEHEASYNGSRCSGHAMALGSAYPVVNSDGTRRRIVQVLTFRCTTAVAIEARVVALRALTVLVRDSGQLDTDIESQIMLALNIALNDYTITERGDVGSLVRIRALETVDAGWMMGTLKTEADGNNQQVYAGVVRLSLEKLDKIRSVAARVLKVVPQRSVQDGDTIEDVSSPFYFMKALHALQSATSKEMTDAICLGYTNSAGMGSESVAQNARDALVGFVDRLPVGREAESEQFSIADLATCLLGLLKDYVDNDRVLVPLLETIAFLFDMQVMQRLTSTSFKYVFKHCMRWHAITDHSSFRSLLSYTQKSHFKSTHMQKLHFALDVYRGLGDIPATRADTLVKVSSMLLHPFPKVCNPHRSL